ncbi:hypothetical protein Ddye_010928 [Dipteronia dyeriana]|uniref:DUF4378 domain-containing protein n=1 Tax=Dipteronia dyeriana TaxID=168575 RepID=A0AAD9XET7_9ROSI|nr:hypothetical protein Ddye_010928 [Dipteronia dyeriana]
MGKHKHEKHEKQARDHNHDLGCVWSIFLQALKYHHWHNVKKRLPHRRHAGNKHVEGDENPENKKSPIVDNQQETSFPEVNSCKVKLKGRQANPGKKTSVKTRIKALINDEKYRRRGRHHRRSSYPEQSQSVQTDSDHCVEPSDEDLLTEIILGDRNPTIVTENNENSDATSSLEKITDEEICEGFQALLNCDNSGHHEVENEKQLIENLMLLRKNLEGKEQVLLEQKLTSKEEVSSESDDSFYQSKEFLEALKLINMNKEFFLKVLQDPSSVVAHHLHNHRPFCVKTGFARSETFPLPGSSCRRDPETSKLKNKKDVIESHEQEEGKSSDSDQAENSIGHESIEDDSTPSLPTIIHDYREDGIQKPNQAKAEITDCASSSSAHHPKNHVVRNEAVIKRFKDLKKKITHALKESKNEKRRITMDAVLHKIPRRQVFSPDLKKKILDQFNDPFIKSDGGRKPGSSNENDHATLIGKTRQNRLTRESSLSDSLDRYRQLYESSFSGEAKQQTSERLKLRKEDTALPSRTATKSLGRIFSLPEIKSYYYQGDDLYGFSPGMPVWTPVGKIVREYPSRLDTPVESHQEKLLEVSETEPMSEDQVRSASAVYSDEGAQVGKVIDESAPDNEQDIEPVTTKLVEPSPDLEGITESTADFSASEELKLQGDSEVELESIHPGEQASLTSHPHESSMDTGIEAHVDASDLDKVEIPTKGNIDILNAKVETKDKAKFDYVRNVLELSGFSRTESLGAWHSDDQPVNPSVYKEVEDYIPLDTDFTTGNECGDCDLMMLLFDLINEVLIDIYERSYSYYPMPLSSLSHIHPMPAGYHVLKEVWENISWYLHLTPQIDHSLDYVVGRDLAKGDEWMNLQFDTECVALEVEGFIFDDLLEELIFT